MARAFPLPSELFPQNSVGFGIRLIAQELETLLPLSTSEETLLAPNCATKRKLEFRAGRHVAKVASEELGVREAEILKEKRRPVFPLGIRGSIAHCGQDEILAVAGATTQALALGIDCEEIKPISRALIRRITTSTESDFIEQITETFNTSDAESALAIFAAKEAVYKAVAQLGFPKLGFQDVELRLERKCPEGKINFVANIEQGRREAQGVVLRLDTTWIASSFAAL